MNFKRQPPPPNYNVERCDFDDGGTNTPERLDYIMNHTGCYGVCDPYDAMWNYYLAMDPGFNSYNILERGDTGLYSDDAYVTYLNRADVQAAIHAPRIQFSACNKDLNEKIGLGDKLITHPQPAAYEIVPTLISQGVKVHIFSGLLDYLVPYTGQELVIQNMTWGGSQGLSAVPTTVSLADTEGTLRAQGREERGLSYYTFKNAGHRVAQDDPETALRWLEQVVIKGPNLPSPWPWSYGRRG